MDTESRSLTEQELRFIDEYLIDHNATQSYFRAYGKTRADGSVISYTSASTNASNLLKKPEIKAEIRAAEAFVARRNRVTADRVVKELAAIAFSRMSDIFDFASAGTIPVPKPLRDIPETAHRAIEKVKVETRTIPQAEGDPITVETVEYKFHAKLSALEKLYQHLGMGPENEVERLLSILPEELRARVAVEIERAAASRAIADGGAVGDRPLQIGGGPD